MVHLERYHRLPIVCVLGLAASFLVKRFAVKPFRQLTNVQTQIAVPPRQTRYTFFGLDGEMLVKHAPLDLHRRLDESVNIMHDDEMTELVQQDDMIVEWNDHEISRSTETVVEPQSEPGPSNVESEQVQRSGSTFQIVAISLAIGVVVLGLVWIFVYTWRVFRRLPERSTTPNLQRKQMEHDTNGCGLVEEPQEDTRSADSWSIGHVSSMTTSVLEASNGNSLVIVKPDRLPIQNIELDYEKCFVDSAQSLPTDSRGTYEGLESNENAHVSPIYCVITSCCRKLGVHFRDAGCKDTHPTISDIESDSTLKERLFQHDIVVAVNDTDTAGWSSRDVGEFLERSCPHCQNLTVTGAPPQIVKLSVVSMRSAQLSPSISTLLEL